MKQELHPGGYKRKQLDFLHARKIFHVRRVFLIVNEEGMLHRQIAESIPLHEKRIDLYRLFVPDHLRLWEFQQVRANNFHTHRVREKLLKESPGDLKIS